MENTKGLEKILAETAEASLQATKDTIEATKESVSLLEKLKKASKENKDESQSDADDFGSLKEDRVDVVYRFTVTRPGGRGRAKSGNRGLITSTSIPFAYSKDPNWKDNVKRELASVHGPALYQGQAYWVSTKKPVTGDRDLEKFPCIFWRITEEEAMEYGWGSQVDEVEEKKDDDVDKAKKELELIKLERNKVEAKAELERTRKEAVKDPEEEKADKRIRDVENSFRSKIEKLEDEKKSFQFSSQYNHLDSKINQLADSFNKFLENKNESDKTSDLKDQIRRLEDKLERQTQAPVQKDDTLPKLIGLLAPAITALVANLTEKKPQQDPLDKIAKLKEVFAPPQRQESTLELLKQLKDLMPQPPPAKDELDRIKKISEMIKDLSPEPESRDDGDPLEKIDETLERMNNIAERMGFVKESDKDAKPTAIDYIRAAKDPIEALGKVFADAMNQKAPQQITPEQLAAYNKAVQERMMLIQAAKAQQQQQVQAQQAQAGEGPQNNNAGLTKQQNEAIIPPASQAPEPLAEKDWQDFSKLIIDAIDTDKSPKDIAEILNTRWPQIVKAFKQLDSKESLENELKQLAGQLADGNLIMSLISKLKTEKGEIFGINLFLELSDFWD